MKMRFIYRAVARRQPSDGLKSVVQAFGMKVASRVRGVHGYRMSPVDIKLTVNRRLDRVTDGRWIGG